MKKRLAKKLLSSESVLYRYCYSRTRPIRLTHITAKSGHWDDPNTWKTKRVNAIPGIGDSVLIKHEVTVPTPTIGEWYFSS